MTERDDLIHQIRNRCDIYAILMSQNKGHELEHLIPTILEDIVEDSQELMTHCVKE